ncbi:7980_t:CDS:2 [Ambispora gerdemannii]|uniref:7980_t:CDS:1 n=1 Tax=Ambispora gerdemannii TaxID=144530 RepID=A0A9N9FN02_9GLOM|nr:7980_t:CDS:2 [Ambispora gerdemannii]
MTILQSDFVNAQATYTTVVNLAARTTWYECQKGTSKSISFSVVLTDGTKTTTPDFGATQPNYLYKSELSGFIVVVAEDVDMKNYVDPSIQLSNYYPLLSCWSKDPVVPVQSCVKSGPLAESKTLCIAVTNPSSNSLQFQLDAPFQGSKTSDEIVVTITQTVTVKSSATANINPNIFGIFIFLWVLIVVTNSAPIINHNRRSTSNSDKLDADLLSDGGDHFMVDLGALDGSKFFPSTSELTGDDNELKSDTVTDTTTTSSTTDAPRKNKLFRPHIRRGKVYVPGFGYMSEKELEELPKGTTRTSQTSEYNGDDAQVNNVSLEDKKNIKDFEHTSGSYIPPGLKKQKVQLIDPQTPVHEHIVVEE